MRRPGQVLGKGSRPVALDESFQPRQMSLVEWTFGADRQTDPMQRNRVMFGNCFEIAMRRPTGAHVVLGMNLEEADIRLPVDDLGIMCRLQAEAGARGKGGWIGHRDGSACSERLGGKLVKPPARGNYMASSMPMWPSTFMVVQVPLGTAFQALPGSPWSMCRRRSCLLRRRNHSGRRAKCRSISPCLPSSRPAAERRARRWQMRWRASQPGQGREFDGSSVFSCERSCLHAPLFGHAFIVSGRSGGLLRCRWNTVS